MVPGAEPAAGQHGAAPLLRPGQSPSGLMYSGQLPTEVHAGPPGPMPGQGTSNGGNLQYSPVGAPMAGGYNVSTQDRKLFNDKVALDRDMKYDGNEKTGHSWRSMTLNYIISKAPECEEILRIVEAHEDVPATWMALAATGIVPPERLQRLAQDIWAHLNLCLTGAARRSFENAPRQEGFEAWRRVLKLVRSQPSPIL